jgi:uncharacterized protein YjbJ (UPF0337 family)
LQALKEQAGEFVSAAADIADHAQEAVSAKVSEALDATKDKIPGWADNVGGALGSASASVKSGVRPFAARNMICEIKCSMWRACLSRKCAMRVRVTNCC